MVKFGIELEKLILIKENLNIHNENGTINKFINIDNFSIFFEFYDNLILKVFIFILFFLKKKSAPS